MPKTNRFHVKEFEENKITVEEERKYRSPFVLFFKNNGKLIFMISMLLSLTVFVIAIYLSITNIKESSIVMYESNGVVVNFDNTDSSILNGTPITKEYADKVFNSNISNLNDLSGVVIKIKEVSYGSGKIIFYSDKTALIKYNDGSFLRVYAVNGDYGIRENGVINSNAITVKATGDKKVNSSLGIELLYLSTGGVEVTKGDMVFFVRNSDLTSNDNSFYTNLSIVSLPIKKDMNKIYYSNGIIKENDYIIVNDNKYEKKEKKKIHDGISIIYYDNGFAEVIKDNMSIMVEKADHIRYDDNIFEIVDNIKNSEEIDIKDVMDIKDIKIKNTNTESVNYMIVLEETDDYSKHNVSRRLLNEYINFNIYVNGDMINNNILNNNLKNTDKNFSFKNNTYLLYEGKLASLEDVSVKIGMWISYEDITNEYMNAAFIGTVKVYVESLS